MAQAVTGKHRPLAPGLYRLSAGPEPRPAHTGPHPGMRVGLTPISAVVTAAATASGSSVIARHRTPGPRALRRPAGLDRRLACRTYRHVASSGSSQRHGHRVRVPRSSVPGIPSSLARRVKSVNIEVSLSSPACSMTSISLRTRCSRAGTLTVPVAARRPGAAPGPKRPAGAPPGARSSACPMREPLQGRPAGARPHRRWLPRRCRAPRTSSAGR